MRKITQKWAFLLMVVLCCLGVPQVVMAQDDCQVIGTGTAASVYYVPIATWYHNSYSQQLYLADEIDHDNGNITSIAFAYNDAQSTTRTISIYMANTDAENLSSAYVTDGFEEVLSATEVTFDNSEEWFVIDLETPFAYEGGNLVVAVYMNYASSETYYASGSRFLQTSATGMVRYSTNDTSSPDQISVVNGVTTASSSTASYRPNVQFCFSAGGGGPTCDKPTIAASDTTSHGITLSWAEGSGVYNVEYKKTADTVWTSLLEGTTLLTATLTNLEPNTAYQARVQSVCGAILSGWRSLSFQTAIGLPYAETLGAATCGWTKYTGLLSSVMAGTPYTTGGYWNFGARNGVLGGPHAYMNLYGENCKHWIVSPAIPLDGNAELTFQVALTDFNSKNPIDNKGTQADDKFVVLVSTDGGATWAILEQWDNAGSARVYDDISPEGDEVTLDLSAYNGQTIQIAFYGESTVSGGDNDIHVGNVLIDYIPTCLKPTDIELLNATQNALQLSWTANTAETAWVLQYKKSAETEWNTVDASSNPFTLTGLDAYTDYDVQVAAVCDPIAGDTSRYSKPATFKTVAGIPFAEGYNDGLPTDWKRFYGDLDGIFNGDSVLEPVTNGWAVGQGSGVFTATDYHLALNIYGIACKYWVVSPAILLDTDVQLTFDMALTKFEGTLTPVTAGEQDDDKFVVLLSLDNGISWEQIYLRDNVSSADAFDNIACSAAGQTVLIDLSAYAGQTVLLAFYGESTVGSEGVGDNLLHIDNLLIDYIPACAKPLTLDVLGVSATSANFAWDEEEGATWEYALLVDAALDSIPASFESGSAHTLTIDTLSPETNYTFFLRKSCGESKSEILARNFTTFRLPEQIPWTVDFEDMTAETVPTYWDNSASSTSTLDTYPGYVWGVYAYGGNKMSRMYNYYVSSGAALINTPLIELPTGVDCELTFDYAHTANCGDMTVKVSVDGGMSWNALAPTYGKTSTGTSYSDPGDFTPVTISLDAYTGNTIMIQFFANANYGSGAIFLDNVSVHEVPDCLKPINIVAPADSATANSVQVAWEAVGPEQYWMIQYKKKADEEWSYVADSVKTNPYIIAGLEPATIYSVRVAAWCDPADSASISEFSAAATVATECGVISSYPFAENFDAVEGASTATHVMPLCWNYLNEGTNTTYNKYPLVYSGASYANSGSNSLKFYSYYSSTAVTTIADQYAILPEMDNLSGLRIKLYASKYSSSYDATFYVGVMSDPDSAATFVAIDTISPASTAYEQYTIKFNSYIGSGKYIAIMMPASTSSYRAVHIDDIVVDEIPDCEEPEGLALAAVKATSAKFKWTNEQSGAWKYAVALATAAEPAADAYLDVDADSVLVEGLESMTEYVFYLRKNCGTSVSASISIPFRTSQLPAALPFADDFEGANTWLLTNGTLTNAWVVDTAAHNGAGNHALYISNDGGAHHAYTVSGSNVVYASKAFAFDNGVYNFQYDWIANGESTFDYIRVALIPASYNLEAGTSLPSGLTTTSVPDGWIALDGGSKLNLSTAWATYTTADIAIEEGEYNVVFVWRNDNSGGTQPPAAIDNFSISKITCLAVENILVPDSTITDASAKVFWTIADSTQTAWQIAIDTIAKNVPDSVTLIDVTSMPYEFTGLVANKKYYFAVRANCGEGDFSKWSAVKNFKTAKSCQKPTGLAASEITVSSAKISWNTFGVDSFNVRYYTADSSIFVDTMHVTMPFVINNLEPSTSYKVRVQPICDETAWSSVYTFKTEFSVPFEEKFDASPADWKMYSGLLQPDTTVTLTTATNWAFGTYNGVFDSHARSNIYGTSCYKWLVTPKVLLTTNNQLTFDMALTKYSGTLAPVDTAQQKDDKFIVLVSTDEGASWTILRKWDNAGSEYVYNNIACSAEGEPVAISLSAYDNQYVQIAFYGESTISGGDNNIHIDNVSLDIVPTCLKLKSLNVSDILAHSALVSWALTDSTQTAWQIAIDTIANFKPDTLSTLIDADTIPFLLSGLEAETTYYMYVRANCGEGDFGRWTDLKSFKTVSECETPTDLKVDSVDYHAVTLSWNAYGLNAFNLRYTADTTWIDTLNIGMPFELNGLADGKTYKVQVQPACAPDSVWSSILSFSTLQLPVAVPFADNFENGNNWLLINGDRINAWVVDTAAHSGEGTHALYISNDGGITNAYTNNIASTVFATKAITIDESAKYVFSYDWRCKGEGFTTDNMWDFIRVILVPADAELVASTELPTGLTYSALPEGWIALDGGQALNNAEDWQTKKVAVEVEAGQYKVVVLWRDDSSSGTNPPAAFDNFSVVIKTCDQPSAVAASNIMPRSATLSWTNGSAEQDAWQIAISTDASLEPDSLGAIDALSNPYELANLNAETTYYVYVRANCGDGDYSAWSSVYSFATLPMCTVLGEPEEATICEGDAYTWRGNSYNVSGMYYDTLISVAGCDSIESLLLIVAAPQDTLSIIADKDTICQGDSFEWNGQEYTQAGIYSVTLQSIYGCDSIAKLELSIYEPEDTIFVAEVISESDLPYTYQAQYVEGESPIFYDLGTEPGVYSDTALVEGVHCDAVLVLELTINKAQGIDNIFGDGENVHKVLYRDVLYIVINDEWYSAEGKKVADPRE